MIFTFKAPSARASYKMRLLDTTSAHKHITACSATRDATRTNVREKEKTEAKTAINEPTCNDIANNQAARGQRSTVMWMVAKTQCQENLGTSGNPGFYVHRNLETPEY